MKLKTFLVLYCFDIGGGLLQLFHRCICQSGQMRKTPKEDRRLYIYAKKNQTKSGRSCDQPMRASVKRSLYSLGLSDIIVRCL